MRYSIQEIDDAMVKAKLFTKNNLVDLCRDLKYLNDEGILKKNCKMRELKELCVPIHPDDPLIMAKNIIHYDAIDFICK